MTEPQVVTSLAAFEAAAADAREVLDGPSPMPLDGHTGDEADHKGGGDGESVWDRPAQTALVETVKIPDAALPAHAKTLNYLNGICARRELTDEDEAICPDADGFLAEGTTSNLFFVADGVLHTPTTEGPVLPGITRRLVCDLAEVLSVPVERGRYEPERLTTADEAFLTNTTWELRPIATHDDTAIGGGPITNRIARAFDTRVERTH